MSFHLQIAVETTVTIVCMHGLCITLHYMEWVLNHTLAPPFLQKQVAAEAQYF